MASRKTPGRTQVERSDATRGALLVAAHALFAQRGYAETSLDDVAREAGVTKGGLYHHFAGKVQLFESVFEQEQMRLAELGVRAYAAKRDQRAGLFEACRSFLESALDPGVQRILLIDGPTVLGWARLHEIEGRYTLANLKLGLERAMADKVIAMRPIEPLLPLLNGALCDAAMFIGRSSDSRAALRATLAEFRLMFDALVAPRD